MQEKEGNFIGGLERMRRYLFYMEKKVLYLSLLDSEIGPAKLFE